MRKLVVFHLILLGLSFSSCLDRVAVAGVQREIARGRGQVRPRHPARGTIEASPS